MKIIRAKSASGDVGYFEWLGGLSGRRLEGSIYGEFRVNEAAEDLKELLAPVEPAVLVGIAQNYRDHVAEMKGKIADVGAYPVYFMKMPGSVQAPGKPIFLPVSAGSGKVDFEAELAVVIGRECRNASVADAKDYILGYTCANDVTARDWQKEWGGGQFCRSKSFDGFCPLGPCLVTADEFSNPDDCMVRGYLNGELMQEASTKDLIASISEVIAFLSSSTTLPAGTVILTGTPAGVGMARTPPVFLKEGDIYRVEVDGIGVLENPVAKEVI
jgi:2-keto-4-pentenoate hydratase/2-oxohepta-3-ene-1,7-dioic acid hydratase in catechol pathway